MRIREENCNMVLLAAVTLFAAAIASGATLVEPTSAGKRIISVGEQPQVRVVGAPFVPNTNPRER
jgi:hypothetical protein